MWRGKTSYLVLGFLILATVFVLLGLPNSKFNWTAVAQYIGGDLPANISNRYISNAGIQVFLTKQNNIEVWGACYNVGSQTKCNELARFAPGSLKVGQTTGTEAFSRTDRDTGWRVVVYFLGTDKGVNVFQVNVYNNGGGLVDDRLILRVQGNNVAFTGR